MCVRLRAQYTHTGFNLYSFGDCSCSESIGRCPLLPLPTALDINKLSKTPKTVWHYTMR